MPSSIVGLGLATFQQITGINTVMYYSPTILKFAGINGVAPAILAGAGLAAVTWRFHVLAIFLLDRVGRRPLLLTGIAGQVVGLAVLGAAFQFQDLASFKSAIAICGLVIYVASFAIGLGPIFWLLISEDLSPEVSRRGNECGDGDQLGNEHGGRRNIPNHGSTHRPCWNVLGVRHDCAGRLVLLLSPGTRNQREDPGTD